MYQTLIQIGEQVIGRSFKKDAKGVMQKIHGPKSTMRLHHYTVIKDGRQIGHTQHKISDSDLYIYF